MPAAGLRGQDSQSAPEQPRQPSVASDITNDVGQDVATQPDSDEKLVRRLQLPKSTVSEIR
jgi:hypothetical protein